MVEVEGQRERTAVNTIFCDNGGEFQNTNFDQY